MIVLDPSAVVAILFDEPEAFGEAIERLGAPRISAANLLAASMIVERRRGEHAGRELGLLLHRAEVQTASVDAERVTVARAAWRRFGQGRHPAGLDYGDCFAYAGGAHRRHAAPLQGDDLSRADVRAAV